MEEAGKDRGKTLEKEDKLVPKIEVAPESLPMVTEMEGEEDTAENDALASESVEDRTLATEIPRTDEVTD